MRPVASAGPMPRHARPFKAAAVNAPVDSAGSLPRAETDGESHEHQQAYERHRAFHD